MNPRLHQYIENQKAHGRRPLTLECYIRPDERKKKSTINSLANRYL